jgi:hypothetical protein
MPVFRKDHAPLESKIRKSGCRFSEKIMLHQREHDPEKHALGLDPMGGCRFSEKIMRQQRF